MSCSVHANISGLLLPSCLIFFFLKQADYRWYQVDVFQFIVFLEEWKPLTAGMCKEYMSGWIIYQELYQGTSVS